MILKKRRRDSEKYKKGDVIYIAFNQGIAEVVHSVKVEKVKGDKVYLSINTGTLSGLVNEVEEMVKKGEELNEKIKMLKKTKIVF